MSHVSGVVLTISVSEGAPEAEDETPLAVAAINATLDRLGKLPLVDVTGMLPRGKHPQIFVYGGGYNYLDEEAVAETVMSQPWERPENVVLVINPEDGPTRVFRPSPTQEIAE